MWSDSTRYSRGSRSDPGGSACSAHTIRRIAPTPTMATSHPRARRSSGGEGGSTPPPPPPPPAHPAAGGVPRGGGGGPPAGGGGGGPPPPADDIDRDISHSDG